MKKIILILGLLGGATLAFGQTTNQERSFKESIGSFGAESGSDASIDWGLLGIQVKKPVLKIGGTLESGVAMINDGQDAPIVYLRGDVEAGGIGGRMDINSDIDMGDIGTHVQLRAEDWNYLPGSAHAYDGSTPGIESAYAYAYILNHSFFLAGGALDTALVKTTGDESFAYTKASAQGVELAILPPFVPGFVFDFFTGEFNKGMDSAGSLTQAQGSTWNLLANLAYAFSAQYAIPKVATFTGGFMTLYQGINSAYGGISISDAVPNLTIELEGKIGVYYKGSFTDSGTYQDASDFGGKVPNIVTDFNSAYITTQLDQWVTYNFSALGVSPLTMGLLTYEWIPGSSSTVLDVQGKQRASSFKINPYATWAFGGTVIPKLGVTYMAGPETLTDNKGSSKMVIAASNSSMYGAVFGDPNNATDTPSSANNSYGANGMALFQIRPEMMVRLNNSANIIFGYSWVTSVGSYALWAYSNPLSPSQLTNGSTTQQSCDVNFHYHW